MRSTPLFKRLLALSTALGLALATALPAAVAADPQAIRSAKPENIIILFADGVASPQWEFGRYSSQAIRQAPFVTAREFFEKGLFGLITTHSNDAMVTDSAAAASAMATGHKVNNGAISMSPEGKPYTTLLAQAQKNGKQIGLVSTASIYDASPAAFSVNARSRRDYQDIVNRYLALQPDVLMGGGRDYFLPAGQDGGKRKDGRNIINDFVGLNYQVVRRAPELSVVQPGKLLGLFAEEDMDFEIDRDAQIQPSLAQMTRAALQALDRSKGFVLFVENENTDTAGHRNDAAALMRDLWAFDDAVAVALEFQKKRPNTLVIVTGDHETGGFSPTYARRGPGPNSGSNRLTVDDVQLKRIAGFKMSLEKATDVFQESVGEKPEAATAKAAMEALLNENFPGITLDDATLQAVLDQQAPGLNFSYLPANTLAHAIARQTGFYWGTSGHTPTPAVVAARGPGAEAFLGYQDNTDFAKHLFRLISER